MSDVSLWSARRLVAALISGELSSVELLEHFVQRIERLDSGLNAVITLDVERAREAAALADAAAARGDVLGPLHGLPMTVKDAFETAGMRTVVGAAELADHVPEQDAVAVARLRAAGAVIFGKTNVPRYTSNGQTFNDVFGQTNNPWNPERSPGGSSGGAAAALAMGFTGLEIGSDIAGSIRVPADLCGVFGLKPSYGIVPDRGHIPGPPGRLAPTDIGVIGPLGREADDLELALSVLAGPDPHEAVGWRLELPPPRAATLGDYRIAVVLDDPYCPVDRELVRVLREALDECERAGLRLTERAAPVELAVADRLHRTLLMGVICSDLDDAGFAAIEAACGDADPDANEILQQNARAMVQRKREWNAANEARARCRARWAEFFTEFDALLCPVAPYADLSHDHRPIDERTMVIDGLRRPAWHQTTWSSFATVAHLPAASVPVGLTGRGMPVGMQVIAPYLEDRTAIDLARRIGSITLGYTPPPLAGETPSLAAARSPAPS
jgi:amidase